MQRPSVVVRFLRERTLLAFVPGGVVVVRSGQSPVLVEAVEEPFFVVVPLHDVIPPVDRLGTRADRVREPKLEQGTARGPVRVVVKELLAALRTPDAAPKHHPRANMRVILVELQGRAGDAANLALLRL